MFSTKELAEKYITAHHDSESEECTDDFNDIEEYVVDAAYEIPKWRTEYETHLHKDTGNLTAEYTRRLYSSAYNWAHVNKYCHWEKSEEQGCAIGRSSISQAHARKLAVEARQKYLREKE